MTIGKITAFDTGGNFFEKEVSVKNGLYGKLLHINSSDSDYFTEYYVVSLRKALRGSFGEDFCIDISGEKHNGFPVFVKRKDILKIAESVSIV